MKTLSKLVAAGVAVAALFSVAGCGSQSTQQEKDPKTLKVWHYEESSGAQGKAWDKAIEIFEKKYGVKVEFEKKSFEQIRQNASQILNSDQVPDVMEYNKGNATAGLLLVALHPPENTMTRALWALVTGTASPITVKMW